MNELLTPETCLKPTSHASEKEDSLASRRIRELELRTRVIETHREREELGGNEYNHPRHASNQANHKCTDTTVVVELLIIHFT